MFEITVVKTFWRTYLKSRLRCISVTGYGFFQSVGELFKETLGVVPPGEKKKKHRKKVRCVFISDVCPPLPAMWPALADNVIHPLLSQLEVHPHLLGLISGCLFHRLPNCRGDYILPAAVISRYRFSKLLPPTCRDVTSAQCAGCKLSPRKTLLASVMSNFESAASARSAALLFGATGRQVLHIRLRKIGTRAGDFISG